MDRQYHPAGWIIGLSAGIILFRLAMPTSIHAVDFSWLNLPFGITENHIGNGFLLATNILPTPTPPPKIKPNIRIISIPGNIQELFEKYGKEYGIDPAKLARISKCESGFNQLAVNGPYGGLFQFHPATWISNRKALGLNPDPGLRFNGEEATRTAAYKMSKDGFGAWPVCGKL